MHETKSRYCFKLIISLLLSFLQLNSYSCESLSFQDSRENVWLAKDFMFDFGAGRVFINQRNVKKTSFSLAWKRASWTSKYASVSFNQPARDFPFGGMNEKGLGMEILWHNAEYPQEVSGKVINESQLIQYVLDMASTVDEAIELIESVTVRRIYAYVHYMICDNSNTCKVVEYKDGTPHIIEMPDNMIRHLGNSDYQDELAFLKNMQENNPSEYTHRFREIYENTEKDNQTISNSIFDFFERTNGLSEDGWSKWNIAYNLTEGKVWFRSYTNKDVKYIDLNEHSLECESGVAELSSSINVSTEDFILDEFTKAQNKEMIGTYDYIPPFIRYIGDIYSRKVHKCKNRKFWRFL